MMVMDSSPARKVEAASEREMERGVFPKKEMEGDDVLPLLIRFVMVMILIVLFLDTKK